MTPPRNFYNLLPSWDPGYAVPEYVEAEGLQNNTFTTKQAPRGTYDAPIVGAAGYAIPKNILNEGIGQGVKVTYMAPRGTKPRVPDYLARPTSQLVGERRADGGVEYQLDVLNGLGDDQGFANPIDAYGIAAADLIMGRLASVPAAQKREALHTTLAVVDPALWNKVDAAASKMVGVDPTEALRRALALNMSRGLAGELRVLGKTRKAPGRNSQLGLACYGPDTAFGDFLQDLGDKPLPAALASAGRKPAASSMTLMTVSTAALQATASDLARWNSLNAATIGLSEWIQVGPFRFPVNGPSSATINAPSGKPTVTMPTEWKAWFADALKPAINAGVALLGNKPTEKVQIGNNSTMGTRVYGGVPADWAKKFPYENQVMIYEADNHSGMAGSVAKGKYVWSSAGFGLDKWFGIPAPMPVWMSYVDNASKKYSIPIARAKHPKTGEDWGVYLDTSPDKLTVTWQKIYVPDQSWLGSLWDAIVDGIKWIGAEIKKAAVAVAEFGADVLGALADLACGVAGNPATATAAMAAGQPEIAVGATVAGAVCGGGAIPAPPMAAPSTSSLTPFLLLGGAGVVAYYLLNKNGG